MLQYGPNGDKQHRPAEMGLTGQSGIAFDVDDDGTVVAAMGAVGRDDFQASVFDGVSWTRIAPAGEAPPGPSQGNARQTSIAFGPDGSVWAAGWDRADDRLRVTRWDGTRWTSLAPTTTTAGPHWRPWSNYSDPQPRIHFNPDGSVWFDGLTLLEGDDLRSVPMPDNSARKLRIAKVSHAPNGVLWQLIFDEDPDIQCPKWVRKGKGKTECPTIPEGVYAITPEAVAAIE